MKADLIDIDLILSRPSYHAGAPVVGTVRIRRPEASGIEAEAPTDLKPPPIRRSVASARLYLAGRAHLGGGAGAARSGGRRTGGSRWRSDREVGQLKRIYGEHACLTAARAEERKRRAGAGAGAGGGSGSDDDDDGDGGLASERAVRKRLRPPSVAHIEQAERLAVHSSLNPSSLAKTNNSRDRSNGNGDSGAQSKSRQDFSHLPTPHENNAVCFWMTNVLELLDVPERHLDRKGVHLRPGRGRFHGDMHPYRPLQLPDLDVVREVWRDLEENIIAAEKDSVEGESSLPSGHDTESKPSDGWEKIVASANSGDEAPTDNDISEEDISEEKQLTLSFRADLPTDIPPTMSCRCVKYFYSAVLVVTTAEEEVCVPFFADMRLPSHEAPSKFILLSPAFCFPCPAARRALPIQGPHVRRGGLLPTEIAPNFHDARSHRRPTRHRPLGRAPRLRVVHGGLRRHADPAHGRGRPPGVRHRLPSHGRA